MRTLHVHLTEMPDQVTREVMFYEGVPSYLLRLHYGEYHMTIRIGGESTIQRKVTGTVIMDSRPELGLSRSRAIHSRETYYAYYDEGRDLPVAPIPWYVTV